MSRRTSIIHFLLIESWADMAYEKDSDEEEE